MRKTRNRLLIMCALAAAAGGMPLEGVLAQQPRKLPAKKLPGKKLPTKKAAAKRPAVKKAEARKPEAAGRGSEQGEAKIVPLEPYRGAVAVDAQNGRVLFSDGADVLAYPASVTKVMTMLLVMEDLRAGLYSAGDVVAASRHARGMEASNLGLKAGDALTVEDLLYAIMVKSANDAAVMLAEHSAHKRAGGGAYDAAAADSEQLVASFVARMNRRAQELGMRRTRYASPNGLPPPKGSRRGFDVSTASDLAKLGMHLAMMPEARRYTSARRRTLKFANGREPLTVYSHNYFLPGMRDPDGHAQAVEGCDGMKTGYTMASGSSIMLTGERNGRRVVVVVLSSRGRWNRERSALRIFSDALSALSLWN